MKCKQYYTSSWEENAEERAKDKINDGYNSLTPEQRVRMDISVWMFGYGMKRLYRKRARAVKPRYSTMRIYNGSLI